MAQVYRAPLAAMAALQLSPDVDGEVVEVAATEMRTFASSLHADPRLRKRLGCLQALPELAAYVFKMLCIIGRSPAVDEARGWEAHWEPLSWDGYDLMGNKKIYYSSGCYVVLLKALCLVSEEVKQIMDHLALYWPPLNVHRATHEQAIDVDRAAHDKATAMQTQLMAVMLAGFRGARQFEEAFLPEGRWIPMNEKLCSVCRAIEYLDAYFVTGFCQHSHEIVRTLDRRRDFLCVSLWENPHNRPGIIKSLGDLHRAQAQPRPLVRIQHSL